MAIHYKGMRNPTWSFAHYTSPSLTLTEKDGQCVVVEASPRPLDDATTYSPEYLSKHPDLMVTGTHIDITSNEDASHLIDTALSNEELSNLNIETNG